MKGYCMLDSAVVKLADVADIILEIRKLIKQRDSSTREVMGRFEQNSDSNDGTVHRGCSVMNMAWEKKGFATYSDTA